MFSVRGLSVLATLFCATAAAPTSENPAAAGVLEKRIYPGQSIFTIGYALCSFTTCLGGKCTGGSREDVWFDERPKADANCQSHDKYGIYGTYALSGVHTVQVCGKKIDLHENKSNGLIDFYTQGGGQHLGTCYHFNGPTHNCVDFLAGGSCTPRSRWDCQSNGQGSPPCV